jgi:epoxyqueuosine reductase
MEIAAAREVPSQRRFVELAHACGFALAGVAPARPIEEFSFYRQWVAEGLAGPMGYLTDHRAAVRSDPRQLLASARSILCLGLLYNTAVSPGARPASEHTDLDAARAKVAARDVGQASACAGLQPRKVRRRPAEAGLQPKVFPTPGPPLSSSSLDHRAPAAPLGSGGIDTPNSCTGCVSRYAWGSGDYHEVLRNALEALAARLRAIWGEFEYRVCVDTAPLLERAYARAAGLGWIGRNTCLINEPLGSWFFLGEILISLALPAGSPPPDRCGTCTRCIDACPTQALIPAAGATGPEWQLDARLCISTLTIEQKGATSEATRAGTGQHLFGCDICQEVCPWNGHSPVTNEPAFQPLNAHLDLAEMATLTREQFRSQFRTTPIWRCKFQGWSRNVATAMGNSGDPRYTEPLSALAQSGDPGVAAHALWALQQVERQDPAGVPGLPGLKEQA